MTYDRRRFLRRVAGTAASAIAMNGATPRSVDGLTELNRAKSYDAPDETFWQLVKDQFALRDGLVMMNAANLCPAPLPISHTVERLTRDVNADASFQNRAKFNQLREHGRNLIAQCVGADVNEIAITRNTSEGNNMVVNGMTLSVGDEVLLWDQNHPTNSLSWDVAAERHGFTVRRFATPPQPTSAQQLVDVVNREFTNRTRVLAFSHVSNTSGIRMPAREICALARRRDVLTLVDGAQSFGALSLDLHDLGCDFFTGSSHKWFLGPKEAGVLYVQQERIEQLWPTHVGVGWGRALENGAQKFDNLGQRDDACVAAMATTAQRHLAIGPSVIEARIQELVAALARGLESVSPEVQFTNPRDPTLSAGILVFAIPGIDGRDLYNTLYARHKVAGAPRGDGVRLSPHIYNTLEDVQQVIDGVRAIVHG